MPALDEAWRQVTGQPVPGPVRDYITSYQDQETKARGQRMTDHAAEAARSAAVILAPDLGRHLPVEVEAALAARAGDQRPDRFFDPVSLSSLIVSVAALAWTIYNVSATSPGKKTTLNPAVQEPEADSVARQIRITLREQEVLPPGTERITEVVVTEIIRSIGKHASNPAAGLSSGRSVFLTISPSRTTLIVSASMDIASDQLTEIDRSRIWPRRSPALPVSEEIHYPVPGLPRVSERARPSFFRTRSTEMARTDSDWTQLGPRRPLSGPMGMWKGSPLSPAGDDGDDQLLIAQFVVGRAGENEHRASPALLMARYQIEVGKQHVTGLIRHRAPSGFLVVLGPLSRRVGQPITGGAALELREVRTGSPAMPAGPRAPCVP